MRTTTFLRHVIGAAALLWLAACGGGLATIGGTVSGLDAGGSVVLQDNGTDNLTVTTNGLRPGYVRKNGIPYGANTVITENYVRLADEGDEFLVVTQSVDDPVNFAPPYVKTYEFKREKDGRDKAEQFCTMWMSRV